MTAEELREKVNAEIFNKDMPENIQLILDKSVCIALEAAIDICAQEATDNQTAQKIASRLSNLIPESAK